MGEELAGLASSAIGGFLVSPLQAADANFRYWAGPVEEPGGANHATAFAFHGPGLHSTTILLEEGVKSERAITRQFAALAHPTLPTPHFHCSTKVQGSEAAVLAVTRGRCSAAVFLTCCARGSRPRRHLEARLFRSAFPGTPLLGLFTVALLPRRPALPCPSSHATRFHFKGGGARIRGAGGQPALGATRVLHRHPRSRL